MVPRLLPLLIPLPRLNNSAIMRFTTTLLSALALVSTAHAAAIDLKNGTSVARIDADIGDTFLAGTSLWDVLEWQRLSWRKHGKKHCLLPNINPCVRDCTIKYLASDSRPYPKHCELICHTTVDWSKDDCTDTSDDEFGLNLGPVVRDTKKKHPDWKPVSNHWHLEKYLRS
ncbi:hypothetical protein FB567DRAFT_2263 [Paraphoma chrysanthemicola]|uniref:Uncharacterized protein n=1 Tax=Paraphoma chrysanthemicola TaxID=798071 RepID=A0A8K0RG80_9PLEO|nr:hypothetical protein FB567DRAFT_2263 [Paraphoma chrysanthemicola]